MQLITLADKYFIETINDEDFVLGLDSTGVYALTNSTDRNRVMKAFQELKGDLSLSNKQIILCYVGDKSPGFDNEVTEEDFDLWLRKVAGGRPRIFDRNDLQDIENCYKDSIDDDLSLINALREYDISDGMIHALMEKKPGTVQEIENLGIVHEVAVEIFDILQEGIYERAGSSPGVPSGITVTLVSFRKRKTIQAFVYVALSAISILILRSFYASFLISMVGYFSVRKAGGKDSPGLTRYAIFMNAFIMIGSGLMCCLQLISIFVLKQA